MNKPRSNCCNAPIKMGGERSTQWFICTQCSKLCDIHALDKDEARKDT